MKRLMNLVLIALAFTFVGCEEDNPENTNPNGNGNEQTTPGGNEQAGGYDSITLVLKGSNIKTAWAAGDEVQVYCVTSGGADVEAKYVLTEGAGSATGKFAPAAGETALEKGGKDYFAAYPYDADRTFAQHNTFTVVVPADQTAAMPLFGAATDAANIELSSFMGAVKFVISGEAELKSIALEDNNSNAPLSGNVTYNAKTGKANFKNSSATKHEINYVLPEKLILDGESDPFIVEVPAGTLADGGKITLFDMNGNAAAVLDFPAQTITAGTVADLGTLSFEAVSQTVDLSIAGTANCYVIPATGEYKFKAVKGNSSEAVNAAKVEVLWETRCDAEEITAGTIIASAKLSGGYVVVKTAKPSVPGNALIVAKDAEDNIIWTWHLWLPETTITNVDDPDGYFWKTALMDRNLGAVVPTDTTAKVSIKSYGLSYQWGRVTPLAGPHFTVSGTAISGYEKVDDTDSAAKSYEYWIANPTVISSGQDSNWLNENNTTLWDNNGEKTIYDPCPVGYRVPVYDAAMPLWKTANRGGTDDDWVFNNELKWYYNKTIKIIFPIGGYLDGGAAVLTKEDRRTCVWSANPGEGDEEAVRGSAAFVDISRDSGKYYYRSYFKYAGGTVRCALEH